MRRKSLYGLPVLILVSNTVLSATEPARKIAWYATLEGGLAEADRSDRPILLTSAAPHCHSVSGVW